jgi:hypothetical protein
MGPRPQGMTIERIDNDGPYAPENCRWATYAEQKRNARHIHLIFYNGKTQCLKDWAQQLGMNYRTLSSRLMREHWSVHRAFTTPAILK